MGKGIHATSRRRQPVTRHPLFPFLVATWFAALFALASFALRNSVIEGWVVSSGFDGIVPAASPPLGGTARILIALACALIGGAVGAAVAWTLARPDAGAKPRRNRATVEDWPGAALADAGGLRLASAAELDASDFDAAAEAPATGEMAKEIERLPPPAQTILPPLRAHAGETTAAQRIAAADMDDLSHVELIERLAIGLELRRQRGTTRLPSGEAPDSLAGLRAFLRPAEMPASPEAADRPVLSFPRAAAGHAAHTASSGNDPAATERALHQALASLQRMSQSN